MDALILIVHGSRDPRWRAPFERFTSQLKAQFGEQKVHLCYMEVATPRLIDVVTELAPSNVKQIQVLPLFMAGGGHVDQDIPRIVEEARQKFRHIQFQILPPIGEMPEVIAAMTAVIRSLLLTKERGRG